MSLKLTKTPSRLDIKLKGQRMLGRVKRRWIRISYRIYRTPLSAENHLVNAFLLDSSLSSGLRCLGLWLVIYLAATSAILVYLVKPSNPLKKVKKTKPSLLYSIFFLRGSQCFHKNCSFMQKNCDFFF